MIVLLHSIFFTAELMVERGRTRRHCVRGARARAVGRAGVRARRFRRAQLVRRGPRGLAVVRRRRALEGTGLLAADKAQHDRANIQELYSEADFEVRSGVKFTLAGWQGPCRVDVVPTLDDLDTYIKMLFADAKKSPLLGPGGPDLSNGGCRRSTYIMPRVARLVDSHHAALKSALDRGIEEAKDSQPSDVS